MSGEYMQRDFQPSKEREILPFAIADINMSTLLGEISQTQGGKSK